MKYQLFGQDLVLLVYEIDADTGDTYACAGSDKVSISQALVHDKKITQEKRGMAIDTLRDPNEDEIQRLVVLYSFYTLLGNMESGIAVLPYFLGKLGDSSSAENV